MHLSIIALFVFVFFACLYVISVLYSTFGTNKDNNNTVTMAVALEDRFM